MTQCHAPLPPLDRNKCDQDMCTSWDGGEGQDCWAGNGEPYSCQEGYEYVLTGDTADADDQSWNEYTCCAAQPSVVVVETSVTTTLNKVDSMWSKLNEHDVNAKLCAHGPDLVHQRDAGEKVQADSGEHEGDARHRRVRQPPAARAAGCK